MLNAPNTRTSAPHVQFPFIPVLLQAGKHCADAASTSISPPKYLLIGQ